MRAKWMGVAVAAVMACGWASEASAAPLNLSFQDSGYIFGTISPDGTFSFPDFTPFSAGIDVVDGVTSGSLTVDSQQAVQISDASFLIVPVSLNDAQIQIGFGGFQLRYTTDRSTFSSGSFSFSTGPSGQFSGEFYYTNPVTGNSEQYFAGSNQVSIAASGYDISAVPLPSTAPLLGAALLGLAGIAGWERRSATAC